MQHHARLYITPNPEQVLSAITAEDKDTAEIIQLVSDTLSIDEVRRIIQLAYQTPGDKSYRQIVIVARQIAHEAQHALLKILEEPPATTRFVLVMPTTAGLLPTVLSRLSLVSQSTGTDLGELFTQFVVADTKVRLDMIADIVKRKAEADYTSLYTGLVVFVAADQVTPSLLGLVNTTLLQLRQKGASKKLLWEELALSLPKVVR